MAKRDKISQKVLTEYEKCQDSAEHYNTMCWVLASTLLALSISLIYIIITQEIVQPKFIDDVTFKVLLFLAGLYCLIYFGFLIEKANSLKNIKYYICKLIENNEGFIGQNKCTTILGEGFKFIAYIRIAIYLLFLAYLVLIFKYFIYNKLICNYQAILLIIIDVIFIIGFIIWVKSNYKTEKKIIRNIHNQFKTQK